MAKPKTTHMKDPTKERGGPRPNLDGVRPLPHARPGSHRRSVMPKMPPLP